MKLSHLSIATLLSVVAVGAFAQAKAPEPDYTLSFNVGGFTDYRYRGISQTRYKPAVQGGLDFAHKSGFYAGAWASNIKWIKDNGVSGGIEVDLYGGYKGEITKDIAFDIGALQYAYVGNDLKKTGIYADANTTELYGAVTMGPVTAKYSHALTRLFGSYGSKGAGYFDLSANFDVGNGLTVTPHIGYQSVGSTAKKIYGADLSYADYSLTVAKDFGNGLVGSIAVVGTDASKVFYTSAANGKFLGKTSAVVGLKYSF